MSVSIRSQLLLLVLSLLLPGVVGVGWLIGRTFEAERQAHERTLRETARALSTVVDSELSQHATTARLLAQSRRLDGAPELDPDDLARFDEQARRALGSTDGWVELRAAGRVLVDTRLPPGTTPDPGTSTGPLAGSPAIRPLSSAGEDGELHAAIVEPVRRDGSVVLDVVVALRPAQLQRIIDQQRLPDRWIAAVLDSHGTVVARHPDAPTFVGHIARPDLKSMMAERKEGLFDSISLDNRRSIGYFSTSHQGWTYVSAMPREEFAGQLPSAVQQVALGSLVLLALAVTGALWVSRRIVLPVQALKGAAARLQAGLPVEKRPTGLNECDEVAAALAEASRTLREGRVELERQVAQAVDRTRQAEQRVSQSQRVEALGRLTGGVAHDFNNLLGVISNSAHLIQRHAAKSPELQMPVSATLRAVEVGSRLTQHLLRFAGRRPVRPQTVELGRYLPELQELLRSVLGRHFEISVHVAPDTWPIHVDSSELELALINLALNARDAMSSGGEVRLQARNATADDTSGALDGRHVLITCSDDGQGMEADLVERVFEPFFTTKAVGKGTGLGLSQVHGFAVQAGGSARLDSTPGIGTTVSMLLPASPGDGDEVVGDPTAARATSAATIAGARVLLVEDNAELGDVTAALIRSHGATVHRAGDAAEALQLLASQPDFDVMLSDIVMPGAMDGLALARRLRTERPALPVVLITGFSASFSAAAADFAVLRKPCSQDDLLAALHAAMTRDSPASRGAAGTPAAD